MCGNNNEPLDTVEAPAPVAQAQAVLRKPAAALILGSCSDEGEPNSNQLAPSHRFRAPFTDETHDGLLDRVLLRSVPSSSQRVVHPLRTAIAEQ